MFTHLYKSTHHLTIGSQPRLDAMKIETIAQPFVTKSKLRLQRKNAKRPLKSQFVRSGNAQK